MLWQAWTIPALSDSMVSWYQVLACKRVGTSCDPDDPLPDCLCNVGICVANPIRLVMEIASLGPLNKFLRRHQ